MQYPRREQKQQIFWEQSYQKVQIGYRKEPKFSSSAKVKKEAKLARKVLPQAKYHPKRHLSTQKPNLSWIRTGVDKTSNLCDRSGHKSSKTLWQKSSQILQKPCDKSRRRTLKKYISVPKSAILKLKPNKDESAILNSRQTKKVNYQRVLVLQAEAAKIDLDQVARGAYHSESQNLAL